jgi:hypothetical protein
MRRISCLRFLAILTTAIFPLVSQAQVESPLAIVPEDREVILSLNFRKIVDSPLFQKVLEEKGGTKARARLQVFRNLTGVDLLEDLDRATFWCRIEDDSSVVLHFQGRFDREKLVNLLMANEKYRERSQMGFTIHEWYDKGEERMKYGAFLRDGSVLIANASPALEASLSVSESGKGLLSSAKADLLPDGHSSAAAWGIVFKPDRPIPGGRFKGSLQAQSLSGTVTLGTRDLVALLSVNAESPEAAQNWYDLAKGCVAFFRLQEERPELRRLAESARVSLGLGPTLVELEASVSNEVLSRLIEQRGSR